MCVCLFVVCNHTNFILTIENTSYCLLHTASYLYLHFHFHLFSPVSIPLFLRPRVRGFVVFYDNIIVVVIIIAISSRSINLSMDIILMYLRTKHIDVCMLSTNK